MRRFKNILVVANPPENASSAVQRAAELTSLQGARLTLVDVLEELPPALQDAGLISDEAWREVTVERETAIQSLIAESKISATAEISTKVLLGVPFIEIIRQVLRDQHDLLVKPPEDPTHGFSVLGSTDMHLLRKCPCPVWMVKPMRRRKYRRIMAAVDPEPSAPNTELNSLILDLATSLAAREQAELHAVAVWGVHNETRLRARAKQSEMDQLIEDVHNTYKRWLKQITKPYEQEGTKFHVHLLKGKTGDIIPAEAEKRRIDIIVMGTVGRVGLPGFFIGNTAERILSRVNCSILAVKPEGFTSPVTLDD